MSNMNRLSLALLAMVALQCSVASEAFATGALVLGEGGVALGEGVEVGVSFQTGVEGSCTSYEHGILSRNGTSKDEVAEILEDSKSCAPAGRRTPYLNGVVAGVKLSKTGQAKIKLFFMEYGLLGNKPGDDCNFEFKGSPHGTFAAFGQAVISGEGKTKGFGCAKGTSSLPMRIDIYSLLTEQPLETRLVS